MKTILRPTDRRQETAWIHLYKTRAIASSQECPDTRSLSLAVLCSVVGVVRLLLVLRKKERVVRVSLSSSLAWPRLSLSLSL